MAICWGTAACLAQLCSLGGHAVLWLGKRWFITMSDATRDLQWHIEKGTISERYLHVQVPLEMSIRETSDAGSPIVVSQAESREAQVYAQIAARVKQKLDRYADLQTDQRRARAKA